MHTRDEVLGWLKSHPQTVHGDAAAVVSRCEYEVKRHAQADAWRCAREYMSHRRELWEKRGGYPISRSSFVAKELCQLFAHELAALHPRVDDGSERSLAGEGVVGLLEPSAWEEVRDWVHDLALEEEEKTWKQVVKFTRRSARGLPEQREGMEADWDTPDGTYGHAAAVIAAQLMDEYERMAWAAEH
jgi:hypothetical protein